jgi:hypothetical protein
MKLDLSGEGVRGFGGQRFCTRCVRVPVYGVSTCLRCLHHLGAAVAASYLCFTDSDRARAEIENMRRVIGVLHKYGVEAPERWVAIAETPKPGYRRGSRPTTFAYSPVPGRSHGRRVIAHTSLGGVR